MNTSGRIINEKLREQQYREGYDRSVDSKGIEWNESINLSKC